MGKSYLNSEVTLLLKLTYNPFHYGKSFGTEQGLAIGDHANDVTVRIKKTCDCNLVHIRAASTSSNCNKFNFVTSNYISIQVYVLNNIH